MINFAEYFEEEANNINWSDIEKTLINYILEEIANNTDRINGKLEPTDTTQTIVKKALKSFYSSNQYKKSLLKLALNIEKKGAETIEEYKKSGIRINEPIKLAIDEHLSSLNESGLNERFNQPLRKIIYENLRRGIGQKGLELSLKDYLKSDTTGFSRYGKNMAIQGASAYSNVIDQTIVTKYKDEIKGFNIVGTLIENSSPQCKLHVELGRKLSIETIQKEVLPTAIENGFKGSKEDVYNLPTMLWHYGCRHRFVPVISEIGLK